VGVRSTDRSWGDYYSNQVTLTACLADVVGHWPYLISVFRLRPRVVIEAGCGPGHHSLALGLVLRHARFVLVDRDTSVLRTARKVTARISRRVHLCKADIRCLPFKDSVVDIAISQGTLEHFDDKEWELAVSEQFRISPRLIFSVPSDQYWRQDYGDEILRTPNQIERLADEVKEVSRQNVAYYPLDVGVRTKLAFYRHLRAQGHGAFRALLRSMKASFHILVRLDRMSGTFREGLEVSAKRPKESE
jgi:SAM-dependent methyltransferase